MSNVQEKIKTQADIADTLLKIAKLEKQLGALASSPKLRVVYIDVEGADRICLNSGFNGCPGASLITAGARKHLENILSKSRRTLAMLEEKYSAC